MQPRILNAIKRLNYIVCHPEKFSSVAIPLYINIMKLLAEVLNEITVIVSNLSATENLDIVMNFTSLLVVSYID
jgi:hypothetical protein